MKRPTTQDTRGAATILRRVLQQVDDGQLASGGPVGVPVLRHLRGALAGLEAAAGDHR
ncbi:MAG: hypothetical protein NVS3B18_09490 [Candidatus Dormibacteria bacterium]